MRSATADFTDPWFVVALLSNVVTLLGTFQWFKGRLNNKNSAILRLEKERDVKEKELDDMESDRDAWKGHFNELKARMPDIALEKAEHEWGEGNHRLANHACQQWLQNEGSAISQILLMRARWAEEHASAHHRGLGACPRNTTGRA
ncbi:MAG TPA: hypothetical protein VGG72_20140 [Bryobacteraceae bacterium]|jgi:hypothetical protein